MSQIMTDVNKIYWNDYYAINVISNYHGFYMHNSQTIP